MCSESAPTFVEFGVNSKRTGRFTWSQIWSGGKKLVVNPTFELIKKDENGLIQQHQQLVIGMEEVKAILDKKEILLKPELNLFELPGFKLTQRLMEEELSMCHGNVEIKSSKNRKLNVTYKQYDLGKSESLYVQVRLFHRKEGQKEFKQITYVNYKLAEFELLLEVLDKFVADGCKIM